MFEHFLAFMVVGFLAQLVDGALGMGFGVISSSILLAQGVPPALASASVNAAKLPTTGTAVPSRAPTVTRQENVAIRVIFRRSSSRNIHRSAVIFDQLRCGQSSMLNVPRTVHF